MKKSMLGQLPRAAVTVAALLLTQLVSAQPAEQAADDDLSSLIGNDEAAEPTPAPAAASEAPPPAETSASPAAGNETTASPQPAEPTTTTTTETIPVAALPAPAAKPKPKSGNRLIEEIVVTAQKREEDIKDVPISIASFSADYLGAKGVVAQQDLPKITPGLTFSAPVGFATAYIRGIGSDAFILADPLVVTYIDGVYFPASTTQFQDFGAVEKVEIDKGPQGTLFGRNALGGVIAISTKDPSLSAPTAYINTTYISYTGTSASRFAQNTSAAFGIPLINDKMALGFSGLYNINDPYYDQRVGPSGDHRRIDGGHAYAIRGKFLWAPTDDSKIKLNVYKYFQTDPQRNFAVNSQPSATGQAGGVTAQDPFKGGDIDGVPLSSDKGLTYFGSGDLNTRFVTIQALTSYQKISAIRNFDFDSSTQPIAYFEAIDDPPNKKPFFANNYSGELRFLSNESAPDWLNLVGGIYYFNQDSGVAKADFQGAGTNLAQGVIAGQTVPGLAELFGPLAAATPIPQGAQLVLGGGLNDESIAFYTQGNVKFTDWVSLTLGGRYQADKRFILYADQGVNLNDGTQRLFFHYSGVNDEMKDGSINTFDHRDYRTSTYDFDPKVSLNFTPADGFLGTQPLIYLNYQTASTGNIFNAISLFDAPTLAIGSKITAYEAGFKTVLFDNLVSLDTSVFHYTEDNAQTQVVSLQSGGAVHFENAPKLRIVGGDFAILAQILPSLTDGGLVLTLSAAYLDSKYVSYPNASGFDEQTGQYSATNDFSGNRVVQTPKLTANAGLNQTFKTAGGPLEFGADIYYNSGYFFLAQNTSNTKQSAYKTVGLTVSYLYERWNTRVSAFGRNVLNEKYFNARFTNDFGTDDFPAQLSTYGLTLRWDYQ